MPNFPEITYFRSSRKVTVSVPEPVSLDVLRAIVSKAHEIATETDDKQEQNVKLGFTSGTLRLPDGSIEKYYYSSAVLP